jgi:hypothetical protein
MRCAWRRGSCWRPHWWPRNRPGVEGQGRGGRRRGGSFSAPLATTFGGAHSPCPPTLSPVNEVSGPANGSLRPTHPITDRGVVRRALLLGSGLRPATGWVVLRSSRDHVQGGARTSPSKLAAGDRGLWPREWVAAHDPPHHRPGGRDGIESRSCCDLSAAALTPTLSQGDRGERCWSSLGSMSGRDSAARTVMGVGRAQRPIRVGNGARAAAGVLMARR